MICTRGPCFGTTYSIARCLEDSHSNRLRMFARFTLFTKCINNISTELYSEILTQYVCFRPTLSRKSPEIAKLRDCVQKSHTPASYLEAVVWIL